MYPFLRMAAVIFRNRNAAALPLLGTHVSHHRCWPWDIDPWMELNNGRTLTLFDMGRIPLAMRTGLARALRRNRWGMAVAGAAIRDRRRGRMFDRLEMRSRCIGWDDRFIYMEQSMWRGGDCTTHLLLRGAVTGRGRGGGIIPPADLLGAMGMQADSPALPDWVLTWIAAENRRPWPPQTPAA
jgi:acyl-CoA thioesterase FadM